MVGVMWWLAVEYWLTVMCVSTHVYRPGIWYTKPLSVHEYSG